METDSLKLLSTIGFNGNYPNGLLLHPDQNSIIYSFGKTIVIKSLIDEDQLLLHGHTDNVSCLQTSKSGSYLASGQKTQMGFNTMVVVWKWNDKTQHSSHLLHKDFIVDVDFTSDELFLISLGGDIYDRNVIIWSLEKKEVLCGCQASQGIEVAAMCLKSANTVNNMFVTGGDRTLRVWHLDSIKYHLTSNTISLRNLKREIICLTVSSNDEFCYCGTTSGDIVKVRLSLKKYLEPSWTAIFLYNLTKKITTRQDAINGYFTRGVTSLLLIENESKLLIGTGNGVICKVREIAVENTSNASSKKINNLIEVMRELKLPGSITSMSKSSNLRTIFIGTNDSQILKFDLDNYNFKTLLTSHTSPITDVVYPSGCSDVFLTSSKNEIRIWAMENTYNQNIIEKRRIRVPTKTCLSLHCMSDGHSIISGWDDGEIRVFSPESGTLLYIISNSHKNSCRSKASDISGVTALSATNDSKFVLSGGADGKVCIWLASPIKQTLVKSMKEHKGAICCICMHSGNRECVSASMDGTSIIWDLERFCRKQIVFANTIFKAIAYGLEECQLLTGGSDNKVSYWELYDGSLIKKTKTGEGIHSVESLEVSDKGQYLVTGGSDGLVKLWPYHKSTVLAIGKGHGGSITKVRIAPDQKSILSVGSDGALLKWKLPLK